MPGILDFLGGPVSTLVSGVKEFVIGKITNESERLQAEAKLVELAAALQTAAQQADAALAQAQRDVIVAEATSDSWLAKNWRPLTMLTFTFIVLWNYVVVPLAHATPAGVPDGMWSLLQLGIGGYIGARTVEKVGPSLVAAFRGGAK